MTANRRALIARIKRAIGRDEITVRRNGRTVPLEKALAKVSEDSLERALALMALNAGIVARAVALLDEWQFALWGPVSHVEQPDDFLHLGTKDTAFADIGEGALRCLSTLHLRPRRLAKVARTGRGSG